MIEVITLARTARQPGWVAAFLAAILAVAVGLLGGAQTSAVSAGYTYDTVAYAYDAPAGSSTAHAAFGAARGSPSGSEVVSWVSQVSVARFGVAANTVESLVGRQYGVGTVVENPGLTIRGFRGASDPAHALNQVINRELSPTVLQQTVANPRVVLQQGSGNLLYLSDEAAVVLRPDGQMITAYGSTNFRPHIFDILADAAG